MRFLKDVPDSCGPGPVMCTSEAMLQVAGMRAATSTAAVFIMVPAHVTRQQAQQYSIMGGFCQPTTSDCLGLNLAQLPCAGL